MKAAFSLLGLTSLAHAVAPTWNSYPGHSLAVENRTLHEIYEAAKQEQGELIVLWGGDAVSQGAPAIEAWNARFPDVKLKLTVDVSKYHDSRVDRQYQRTRSDGADIAVLQTLHDFTRWKMEGRLLPYKPPHFDDVWASVKDADGAYYGTFIHGFGSFTYNPDRVQDSDVPSTFDELIQPKWKGKLALTYPNDDDAITFLFSILINKYGWDWFEALIKQDVQWIRGTGEPANYIALANSTRSLSFTTGASGKLKIKKPEDPIMLWPQTSAIFASTLRPESAKLFMSWLLSDEYQANFNGTYVIRKDLAEASSATSNPWDDQYSGLSQFATFMDNRDQVEWWRLQFETSIGTAQGVSPVQSFYGRQ